MRLLVCLVLVRLVAAAAAGAQGPAPVHWGDVLRQPDAWYGQPEAKAVADSVRRYQRSTGGWPKDIDMTQPPAAVPAGGATDSTIDNGATVTQIRLLARVFHAGGDARDRDAVLRGLDYLFAAQYPNGGWPQFYPLRPDYSRYITFNDNAMIGVMTLLDDLAQGRERLAFVDQERRTRAAAAVGRGLEVILRAQVRVNSTPTRTDRASGAPASTPTRTDRASGAPASTPTRTDRASGAPASTPTRTDRASGAPASTPTRTDRASGAPAGRLTAWCAQHDEVTLEPRHARTYEHPSLSGFETVGIVRFLMDRREADPRIPLAVGAAVAWLEAVKLEGWRVEQRPDPALPGGFDRVMVRDPSAPPLWARFYDIATNRPIFSGRDGVIRTSLDQIEHERRVGYAWVGDWPRTLLTTDYPAWRARQSK